MYNTGAVFNDFQNKVDQLRSNSADVTNNLDSFSPKLVILFQIINKLFNI